MTLMAPARGRKAPPDADAGSSAAASREQDERLVERAQAGDSDAFNELAEKHTPMMLRILFRMLKDCERAWDAVQEALIKGWRNVGKFEGRSKFSTWLTRIGINEAYRGLARSPAEASDLDSIGDTVPGWGDRPDETFESREFLGVVSTALDSLPEDHRVPIVLRDLEGLSNRDAAESIGIEERAFKSRLHRGRMALRAELDDYFEAGYVK